MLKMVFKEGDTSVTLELEKDVITIGRSTENMIVVKNRKASRRHARIERIGGTYQITDLGSGNGTKVNGKKIDFDTLKAGDEIRVGDAILVLESIDDAVDAGDVGDNGAEKADATPLDEPAIQIQDDSEDLSLRDEPETEVEIKPPPRSPRK
jgi:pSer/pThr/pTyr-binding forkhead associated (FHA) protein